MPPKTNNYKRTKITQNEINATFNKLEKVPRQNSDKYRVDACNNIICKDSYGKKSKLGWEIDHINPISKGGSNSINNLQALQINQNKSKSNKINYDHNKQKLNPKGIDICRK